MARRFDSEAERLADCRRVFERALRDGIAMTEARELVDRDDARARLAESQARAAERKARVAALRAEPITPKPRFYWQEGPMA